MSGYNPFNPQPDVVGERTSDYTHGEMAALLAPALGIDAGDLTEIAIVARIKGGLITFGGSHGVHHAKNLIADAIISGVLGYQGNLD